MTRAKEILALDCVSQCPKIGCFVVRSDDKFYTVSIFPSSKCSCPAVQDCVHILAVKLSVNVPEIDLKPEKKTVNLTTLRKNVRGRKKPGRKRPRLGDIDIEPAKDSEVGKSEKEKDIVAEESWIESDGIITSSLKKKDKWIVDGTAEIGWLNDRIIDASMQIIKHQYHANGLQSCLLAAKPELFKVLMGEWVQIVNTSAKTGGSHWILLSTYGEKPQNEIPIVNIYDSLWSGVTSDGIIECIKKKQKSQPSVSSIPSIPSLPVIDFEPELATSVKTKVPKLKPKSKPKPQSSQCPKPPKIPKINDKCSKPKDGDEKTVSPTVFSQRGRRVKKNRRKSFLYN
jgi:hypothetical protein